MDHAGADSAHDERGFSGPWWRFPPLRNALLAAVVAAPALLLERSGWLPVLWTTGAYSVAIALGGWHWARDGIEDLMRERVIGIQILMLAATSGAALLGLWDEAATLVVLYGAAEGVEEFTYARTRASIRALLDLAPKQVALLDGAGERTIPADRVKAGDRFVVRPGEGIATDGIVAEGRSEVDEAPVTGESMPIDKAPGSKVFAGSINGQGVLVIVSTAAFADNTLSQIIRLVEQAHEQKGRAQQWIERFGRRYSPSVLVACALLLVIPWLLGWPLDAWAQRATVLLVAAAPCALVMSMPMAMAAGIGSAGKRGILIKGGAHLEHLGRISIVAFDKTGTLTSGTPAVTDVKPLRGTEEELLIFAAGIEQFSQHPLAQAIVAAAHQRGLEPVQSAAFQSMPGHGVRTVIEGRTWLVGNPTLMREHRIDVGVADALTRDLQLQGKTVVLIACGDELQGLIALQDRPRPEAAKVIRALHEFGVHTVMLTGDNELAGKSIGKALGIDKVLAELKPKDKVEAIRVLEREGSVLMVGDGVNDAPALACATCGVAMAAAGSDAAIEAADIALMADDLGKLPEALALGRKVKRIARQNIVLSIAVLAALIPLAVTGWISIAIAVLVHETAELLAVGNGLRAGKTAVRVRPVRRAAPVSGGPN